MTEKQRKSKKIEAEIGSIPKETKEETAIKEKVKYTPDMFVQAIEDASVKINNAFFRTPFNRCPDCVKKGNNAVMVYFGVGGHADRIGNLKGFQATIGDVIAWASNTYKGLSVVKAKDNGVYTLETAPFNTERKEPAVVEVMLVPSAYRGIIEEMAQALAEIDKYAEDELTEIGKRKYPNAIAKKL